MMWGIKIVFQKTIINLLIISIITIIINLIVLGSNSLHVIWIPNWIILHQNAHNQIKVTFYRFHDYILFIKQQ